VVSYPLGEQGKKTLHFEDGQLNVEVELAGAITETVPVMVKEGDTLTAEGSQVVLKRGGRQVMSIAFGNGAKVEIGEPAGEEIGPYRVAAVRARSEGALKYSVIVAPSNP
jgi:hypothetical protein